MYAARVIPSEHKDLIHDVSFDFYGTRMATCSSDQSVKVWDQDEDGHWQCTADWKTHSGSVWKVTWAHPEFGQVLATCSFDRTASIWEEQVGDAGPFQQGGRTSHWVRRAALVDSRTSVTDIKFAPKHLGLMLATCSKDGIVRIYEAPDVMNLAHWSLQYEIHTKLSCSCLSWNPSRIHSPMLAVGSDDTNSATEAKTHIYQLNEYSDGANRKWQRVTGITSSTDPVHDVAFAPNVGRPHHLLAIAGKDVQILNIKPASRDSGIGLPSKMDSIVAAIFKDHETQVWRVEWNITGTILASSGDDGCIRLWKANYLDNWKCIAELKGDGAPVPGSTAGKFVGSQQAIRETGPYNPANIANFRSHPMW